MLRLSVFAKIRHYFRWGQTPLTDAKQFKHTKVAAMLTRRVSPCWLNPSRARRGSRLTITEFLANIALDSRKW